VVGQTNRYSSTASCAEFALRYIRAEAVPALLKALDDPSQPSRVSVAEFLGQRDIIGTNAPLVVPVLAKCLDDPDAELAAAAAMALGQLRAEPEIAVPSLIKAARNTNHNAVQSRAWYALKQIAPEVLLTNRSSQGHE
jgi:HEAT repeat protein